MHLCICLFVYVKCKEWCSEHLPPSLKKRTLSYPFPLKGHHFSEFSFPCFPCSSSTYVQSLKYIAYFYIRWNLYIMYFSATCFFPTNILFLSFIHFIVCSCIYWLYSIVQLYCIFFVQSIGDGLSGLFQVFCLLFLTVLWWDLFMCHVPICKSFLILCLRCMIARS